MIQIKVIKLFCLITYLMYVQNNYLDDCFCKLYLNVIIRVIDIGGDFKNVTKNLKINIDFDFPLNAI